MIRFLLNRITVLFFLVLAIGVGGAMAVQFLYVAPKKQCEAAGNLWAEKWGACATPMDVRDMTAAPVLPTVAAPPATKS